MNVNDKAFDFRLPDKDGVIHRLSDYKGKKVVVYFYPKDDTPGCTKQACAFRDSHSDFSEKDIVVIGISKDSKEAHKAFVEKYNLPFILLSDPDMQAIENYGVWAEKNLYGKKYMGINRSTFIIDEEGKIIKIYKRATPDKNAKQILEFLDK